MAIFGTEEHYKDHLALMVLSICTCVSNFCIWIVFSSKANNYWKEVFVGQTFVGFWVIQELCVNRTNCFWPHLFFRFWQLCPGIPLFLALGRGYIFLTHENSYIYFKQYTSLFIALTFQSSARYIECIMTPQWHIGVSSLSIHGNQWKWCTSPFKSTYSVLQVLFVVPRITRHQVRRKLSTKSVINTSEVSQSHRKNSIFALLINAQQQWHTCYFLGTENGTCGNSNGDIGNVRHGLAWFASGRENKAGPAFLTNRVQGSAVDLEDVLVFPSEKGWLPNFNQGEKASLDI